MMHTLNVSRVQEQSQTRVNIHYQILEASEDLPEYSHQENEGTAHRHSRELGGQGRPRKEEKGICKVLPGTDSAGAEVLPI